MMHSMLSLVWIIITIILKVNGQTSDGYTSDCGTNTTLFVQKGHTATFKINLSEWFHYFMVRFYSGIRDRDRKITVHWYDRDDLDSDILDERYNASVAGNDSINIAFRNVRIEDSGMFMASTYRSRMCWELIVLDIWSSQDPPIFEEFGPVSIHVSPPASRLVRPRVNATATWLLDGFQFPQTIEHLTLDGQMVLLKPSRNLSDTEITYRIVEDNGQVHDVNLTIIIAFGPDSLLQFNPPATFHYLAVGDNMPDVSCLTHCNPTCQITWDRGGNGNMLSLGKVDLTTEGMYTCQARRNDTNAVVERYIYVRVNDDTSLPAAFVVSIVLQGVTMAFLTVVGVLWCRKKYFATTESRLKKNKDTNCNVNQQNVSTFEVHMYEGIEMSNQPTTNETYENLSV